jgi:hypothetical protein
MKRRANARKFFRRFLIKIANSQARFARVCKQTLRRKNFQAGHSPLTAPLNLLITIRKRYRSGKEGIVERSYIESFPFGRRAVEDYILKIGAAVERHVGDGGYLG